MTLQSYYTRLLKNIHFLLFCMLMTAFPPYSNGIIQHTEEKEEFMLMLLVCLCTYALVGTCGGQKWVLGIFLNHSLLYVLRQSLNLELTNSARLAHWPRPGVCLCLSPPPYNAGVTDVSCRLWLFTWVLGPELRSSCLHDKHFTNSAILLFPRIKS